MLEIYGRFEDDRSLTLPSFGAEIAVVGWEIIGVAACSGEALTCLYVLERFRNSGVGTCLLHNVMLSGVKTAIIPSGNFRALTFFKLRGWCSQGETVIDVGGEKLRGIAMHYRKGN